ncbi:MAG: hypothetical protein JSR95_17100 [Proteobacteria bacterium]|nr:hypothetical protein [Pseudomonadota bacterium]
MRSAILALPPLLMSLLLAACAQEKPPPPPAASPPAPTVFDPLTQTMDRARAVQGTVDAQAQATRKAVEEAEGGDSK